MIHIIFTRTPKSFNTSSEMVFREARNNSVQHDLVKQVDSNFWHLTLSDLFCFANFDAVKLQEIFNVTIITKKA